MNWKERIGDLLNEIMDSELFYWAKTLTALALFVLLTTQIYKSCHPEVIVPGQYNAAPTSQCDTNCICPKK